MSKHKLSITFIIGLCLAAGVAFTLDSSTTFLLRQSGQAFDFSSERILELMAPRQLDARDIKAANQAWRYFENNTQPDTGLVDSVKGFPSATLWDQGSYLLALVAAQRLEIVSDAEFTDRVDLFLASLARLQLIEGKLPNKVYDTRNLAMVDYENQGVEGGIGWSALDIARLLVGLRALELHHPKYAKESHRIIAQWSLSQMAYQGELWGSSRIAGDLKILQEGRLGYEQYGARAAAIWGLDVSQSISADRALEWRDIDGISIAVDARRAASFHAITPILSEPYVLMALEIGFDAETSLVAERVFLAQQARYKRTGHITMVSEDHVNTEPSFLYSSVFANARDWAVVSESGKFFPKLRSQSTKATIAWDVIYDTDYTDLARARLDTLESDDTSWPAGIYEADGRINDVYALNTNAVILEAIHYKVFGPLLALHN